MPCEGTSRRIRSGCSASGRSRSSLRVGTSTVRLCAHLRVIPVFVVRAMPRIWVVEVARRGGFTLVMRHQLYPLSHKRLALEVRATLGLPVDAPRALYDGTMQRFVSWHDARRGVDRGGEPAGT